MHLSQLYHTIKNKWVKIPDEHLQKFDQTRGYVNYSRMRLCFVLLFIFSLFVIYSDIQMIEFWDSEKGYKLYFLLDIFLLISVSILLFLSFINRPKAIEEITLFHHAQAVFLSFFIIVWCAMVAAIEQTISGSISSLIIGAFAIASGFYLRGWVLLSIYIFGILCFVQTQHHLQYISDHFFSKNINLISLILFSWGISRVFFHAKAQHFVSQTIISENNKRLKHEINERKRTEADLQKAKNGLESSVQERTAELVDTAERLKIEIKERKETEEALRASEERISSLLETVPNGICECDTNGVITMANSAYVRITGYNSKEVLNMYIWEFLEPGNHKEMLPLRLKHLINEQPSPSPFLTRHITKDGKLIDVQIDWTYKRDSQNKVAGFACVLSDITYRKKAEAEKQKLEAKLQQAQKMEAIGTLAGGIAHDFNNILSIILGNTELALEDIPQWNLAKESLDQIKIASLRAKGVIQQLLSFSRNSEQNRIRINISPIIKESLKLMRSSLPSTIDIRLNMTAYPDTIVADPTQIHQIMINLCSNAAHAMEKNGGVLEVNLINIELNKSDSESHHGITPGNYVKISVKDTGCGIAPEIKGKIFDPYFTTKEIGKGTGMGLAMVSGIVRRNGGYITVDSDFGKGTAFDIFLPVLNPDESDTQDTSLIQVPTGKERILLVDDEYQIVRMGTQMLKHLGYHVTSKTSSVEALELFRSHPDKYDLIISDTTMPDMPGDTFSRKLLEIRPTIPIVLCTGFSERIDEEKTKSIGIRALLMKPVTKNELAETIRKILDGTK